MISERHVMLIDEFHLLPRYKHSRPIESRYLDILDDLEALAGVISKDPRYSRMVLVLTVSEGFAATELARSKLLGYDAAWMLVEHLDPVHFRALHREYAGLNECRLDANKLLGLVGGTPGYLPELCRLTEDQVVEMYIPLWLENLEAALSWARSVLASDIFRREVTPREVIELAYHLLRGKVKPLEDPHLHTLGQVLTMYNIVYPVYAVGEGIYYKSQYPVYRIAVDLAYEKGVESILRLDPRSVYEEAVKTEIG